MDQIRTVEGDSSTGGGGPKAHRAALRQRGIAIQERVPRKSTRPSGDTTNQRILVFPVGVPIVLTNRAGTLKVISYMSQTWKRRIARGPVPDPALIGLSGRRCNGQQSSN